jgi:hypothetical protein
LNLGLFEYEPEELLIPKRPVFSVFIFFRRFSVSSEKRVLDLPDVTARISAAPSGTNFCEILVLRTCTKICIKKKKIPLQAWTGPEDSRRLRLPDFKTIGT